MRPIVLKMCPEFSALDEKEILVISYVYDYYSIYRQHNERSRIAYAIMRVYGDNNPKLLDALEKPVANSRITNAVNAYKSLQYDPKIELAHKYQETVDEIQTQINSDLSEKELDTKLKNIDRLRKSIQSLEHEITDQLIADEQLKGDQTLSLVERLQRNKNLWLQVIKKRSK